DRLGPRRRSRPVARPGRGPGTTAGRTGAPGPGPGGWAARRVVDTHRRRGPLRAGGGGQPRSRRASPPARWRGGSRWAGRDRRCAAPVAAVREVAGAAGPRRPRGRPNVAVVERRRGYRSADDVRRRRARRSPRAGARPGGERGRGRRGGGARSPHLVGTGRRDVAGRRPRRGRALHGPTVHDLTTA